MSSSHRPEAHVTIRFARPDDAAAIARLARLDSAHPPQGRLLVAEVAGRLRVALPLDGGPAIADPFESTRDLLGLLEVRRQQTLRPKVVRRWPLDGRALVAAAFGAGRWRG
jgi:hypothetical protein